MVAETIQIIIEGRDTLSPAAKAASRALDDLGRKAVGTGSTVKTTGEHSGAAGRQMHDMGEHAKHATHGMAGMDAMMASMSMTMLGMPFVALAGGALKASADFEQLANVAQVVSSSTDDQRKSMEALALKLGKDTVFSAKQAMEGMTELAKAGLGVDQIMAAMSGTLDMAAAGDIAVKDAAELAANAMNAFHLQAADTTRVANLLAAAANASSLEIRDLSDAFRMSSAVASTAGLSIDELTTALAVMGNAGVKGSDAGTSVKQMLLALQTPSKEATKQMQNMGITLYDNEGKMLSLRTIIAQFTAATATMTDKERDFALGTIFGSDAVRVANIVLTQGTEKYDAMAKAVTKSGAAQEVANARMKGLAGAVKYFSGSLQTAFIEGATPFNDSLGGMIRGAADLISGFAGLPGPVLQITGLLVGLTGAVLVGGGATMGIVASLQMMNSVLKLSVLASHAMTVAQWLLNAAMTANPIGIVVVGLAALAAGLVWAYQNVEGFRNIVIGAWEALQGLISGLKSFLGISDQVSLSVRQTTTKFGEMADKIPDAFEDTAMKAGKAVTNLTSKAEKEFDLMVLDIGQKLRRLGESYTETTGDMRDKHTKALWDIREREDEARRDYGETMGERLAAFNETMAETVKSHQKAEDKIDEEYTDSTVKFRRQMAERIESFDEAMSTLTESHRQAQDKIGRDQAEANVDFATRVAERKITWQEAMTALARSHADAINETSQRMAELNAQFATDTAARRKLYDQELSTAPDTFLRRRDASKRTSEEINKDIQDELAKGAGADMELVASLTQRMVEESKIQKQSYAQYLKQLRDRQAAEERAATEKRNKELSALQSQLDKEKAKHVEQTAKLKAEYDKDVAHYKGALAEKESDLSLRRAEENKEFEARTAKGQKEYNKDVEEFRRALSERQAELIKQRGEEDKEFEARTLKANQEYYKDSDNAAAALARKLEGFRKQRVDEQLELVAAMADRQKEYDKDVEAVRDAEAAKTKEFTDRMENERKVREAVEKAQSPGESSTPATPGDQELPPLTFPPGIGNIDFTRTIGIPNYDAGGIVPGPAGMPQVAVVHGGETITPAGRGGDINIYLTVQGSVLSERNLLDVLRRGLITLQRNNVTSGVV